MTFFSHRPFLRFSGLPYLTDCPSFLFLNSKFSQQTFLNDRFFTLSYFTDDDSYFLLFAHYAPPCITHPHAGFTFLHLALCSRSSKYCIHHLFLLDSSLHKQPFITAHFRSSLHILCITAH